jgi:hypothetical protein
MNHLTPENLICLAVVPLLVIFIKGFLPKSTADEEACMKRTFRCRYQQIEKLKTPEQFATLEKLIDDDAERFRSKLDHKLVNEKVGYLETQSLPGSTDELYGIPHTGYTLV